MLCLIYIITIHIISYMLLVILIQCTYSYSVSSNDSNSDSAIMSGVRHIG